MPKASLISKPHPAPVSQNIPGNYQKCTSKQKGDPADSSLLDDFNDLLCVALDACNAPVPSKGMTAMTIRHMAFRLPLEEVPSLLQSPQIATFAANGMTSATMLHRTYLRFIDQETTAQKVRQQAKPSDWSMTRRALDPP